MAKKKKKASEKKIIKFEVPKINLWMASTIALAILSIVLIFHHPITGRALSAEEAANKAVDYLNNNVLRGQTAELLNVTERKGLYYLKLRIGGRLFDSYITKDGSLLFPSAIELEKVVETPKTPEAFDAPDREIPNVKFFVMSFCPFGNQAEEGLEPVFRLLGNKVEWEPHYVIYSDYASGYPEYCLDEENKYCSMHGIQELNQNIRELCVWKYYEHGVWWDFVLKVNDQCSSRNADTCWEPIAKEFGIDVEKIKTCQEQEAIDFLAEEVALNKDYGVRGSPTVFINDKRYRGGRSPEAYKQAICSGFITKPDECSQQLSSVGGAAGGGCA